MTDHEFQSLALSQLPSLHGNQTKRSNRNEQENTVSIDAWLAMNEANSRTLRIGGVGAKYRARLLIGTEQYLVGETTTSVHEALVSLEEALSYEAGKIQRRGVND